MNRTRLTPKEHGILFSGEMVRAILDGSKTQTRRLVPDQPLCEPERFIKIGGPQGLVDSCKWRKGDRLWVRETFCLESSGGTGYLPDVLPDRPHLNIKREDENGYDDRLIPHYRATDPEPELCYEDETDRPGCKACEEGEPHCHWKPSIHMPRWASRLTLEIVSVKVERLNDISIDDAIAEGCEETSEACYTCGGSGTHPYGDCCSCDGGVNFTSPKENFAQLWESINGPGSWDSNPFVWAIEFKAVK